MWRPIWTALPQGQGVTNELFLARDLVATGHDYAQLTRMHRQGALHHLRRGAYIPVNLATEDQRRLSVEAGYRLATSDSVLSFGSAAVLHGLPVWPDAVERVHLTRSRRFSGRIRSAVHVHVALLDEADVTAIGGMRVTSLARTCADLARTVPLRQAVAAGDQALRRGMTRGQLADQVDAAARRYGVGRARVVTRLVDERSESVGESVSRCAMIEAGICLPELQAVISGDGFDARVDFLWRAQRVIGEFDGKIKYGRLLRRGEHPGDVVYAEKLREDRLRELGYRVVRWTWHDLADLSTFAERIRRALRAGADREH